MQTRRGLHRLALRARLTLTLGILSAVLLAVMVASAANGPVRIPYATTASVLLSNVGVPVGADVDATSRRIIKHIRLPRIVVAALVGAALAVSGVAMQALFRNPMADAGVLGVSSGGALGAVIAIVTGLQAVHIFFLPLMSFAGALGAAFLVYFLATAIGGRLSTSALLLTGLAMTSFLGACISTLLLFSVSNPDAVRQILYWLTGGLDGQSWQGAGIIVGPIVAGIVVLAAFARDLNVLLLGEETAHSLGVSSGTVRRVLLAVTALITGVAVAVSGTIAFVGLMVPHMLRLVIGPDHRLLLPASALGGAIFLVAADTVARLVIQPAEMQVGMVTALLGAPFFLVLLYQRRKQLGGV
ncbi:MAG: iron ABC transporter permease [Dehalococcoidia bacterium]|nr:iron ABC transporter permease [Dehalococcoidia bacterium]